MNRLAMAAKKHHTEVTAYFQAKTAISMPEKISRPVCLIQRCDDIKNSVHIRRKQRGRVFFERVV